ncbi:MAG: DUF3096 domain-containing protein [Thermoplasmata archaeon]|nr:DUF3096 domain-containing protein [Thermoplasmata archaeon]
MGDKEKQEAREKARLAALEAKERAKEVHQGVRQVNKDILAVAGGDRIVNWDKYFGMGYYGAVLSVIAGILILAYPDLVPYIVAVYLIFRGFMEALRHTKSQLKKVITGSQA